MKRYWVYVHTCKANGKRYVGVTTASKPERRWLEGNGYKHQLFGRAILKHGWDNFEHEVFEVDSEEEMYRKEVELISFYHSNDPRYGYNNSVGGEKGTLGCKHSEEFRRKLSEANRDKTLSEETRKKISEANRGKTLSEETRKKKSEAAKKRCLDPEYRKKMSEVCKERWSDPEYREKMLEARKGKPRSEEFRKKMSEVRKKEWSDPEVRRKRSEALKGKPRSEEARKHIAEAKKGRPHRPHSEETRKKLSEAAKNRPRVKIKLPDGTTVEITKQLLTRDYVNKGKKFEYVS